MIGRNRKVCPLIQSFLLILQDQVHGVDRIFAQRQSRGQLLALAPARARQSLDDQLGALDGIAGLLAIDLIEPVAEGIEDGFEIVSHFLGRDPVPAAEEVGAEIARLDADDADAQVLDLVAQALGDAHERELGRAVQPTPDLPAPPPHRAHVGDHARLARPHVRQNGTCDRQLAEHVGVE